MQIKYHPFVFTSDFRVSLDPNQIQGLSGYMYVLQEFESADNPY